MQPATFPAPEHGFLSRVKVRLVTEQDLPAMEWEGEFTHLRRVYQETYERTVKGLALMWIADLPEVGILGQAFIQLICDRPELANGKDRAYMFSFRVRNQYRNQGLGSRMIRTFENDLIKRGFRFLTLNVAKENYQAQQLYSKFGYQIVAPEPGVWSYPDQNGDWHTVVEPAWRMQKLLISPQPRL
ncbi:MAG TPA: N-acetyltransferase [Longilinea sp.]|nr:N-acetyltransferase [Longilinea sp.]